MIRIERIPAPPPVPTQPHYKLYCDYMIGDGDGDETLEAYISLNNPYVERFVTLMDKFEFMEYQLDADAIKTLASVDASVTADDQDFLARCFFPNKYKTSKKTKDKFKTETPDQTKFLDEFQYCIESEDAGGMYPRALTLQESYLRFFDEHSFEYYAHVEPNIPDETRH